MVDGAGFTDEAKAEVGLKRVFRVAVSGTGFGFGKSGRMLASPGNWRGGRESVFPK
jgi:hypothetical protein